MARRRHPTHWAALRRRTMGPLRLPARVGGRVLRSHALQRLSGGAPSRWPLVGRRAEEGFVEGGRPLALARWPLRRSRCGPVLHERDWRHPALVLVEGAFFPFPTHHHLPHFVEGWYCMARVHAAPGGRRISAREDVCACVFVGVRVCVSRSCCVMRARGCWLYRNRRRTCMLALPHRAPRAPIAV